LMATGSGLRFGIAVVPAIEALEADRQLVRVADEAGLDLVGIQDHPYQRHFLDTWSLIPTLAAETKRISFFTDVANLPLRPPAVMAKAAATLDVLSGGRFELGLGAGGIPDVIANFGGPRRTPGEAVEALEEAIDIIRLLWSGAPSVSFEGQYYTLNDARPGPQPAHEIAIWVGAFKPRMLRLVGRKADGWLPSLGVLSRDELRSAQDVIDAATRPPSGGSSTCKESSATPPLRCDPRCPWATSQASHSPAHPTGGSRACPASSQMASTRSSSGPLTPRPSRWSSSSTRSCRTSGTGYRLPEPRGAFREARRPRPAVGHRSRAAKARARPSCDRRYGPQSGAESQVFVRVIGCMSEPFTRIAQMS
jgi:hypothetical protein